MVATPAPSGQPSVRYSNRRLRPRCRLRSRGGVAARRCLTRHSTDRAPPILIFARHIAVHTIAGRGITAAGGSAGSHRVAKARGSAARPWAVRQRTVGGKTDKANGNRMRRGRQPGRPCSTKLFALSWVRAAFWQQVPSWLLSSVFHLVFILILASYSVVAGSRSQSALLATIAGGAGDGQGFDDGGGLDEPVASAPLGTELKEVLQPTSPGSVGGGTVDSSALLPAAPDIGSPLNALTVPIGGSGTGTGLGGAATGVEGGLLEGIGNSITDSLQGRLSATNRARLVGTGGGTPASENAVASG